MTSIRNAVEDRYNSIFARSSGKKHGAASAEEIISAFTSKNKSLRFKVLADLGSLKAKVRARADAGEPLKVAVMWGYGKDGFCFRKYDEEWYKPDMADVFTLGVVGSVISSVDYPLDVTLIYTTARYLNTNYYHIGHKPEKWLEDGLNDFAKSFEKLCSHLLPSVDVHDCYLLNERAGIDMEHEIRKDYVQEEYDKIKGEDKFLEMFHHVKKHSPNPAKSLERYTKEKIVEMKCKVSDPDIAMYFSGNVFGAIRYHTTPNRKFPDIIPPWSAEGGIVVSGEEWHERMVSHNRILEMPTDRVIEHFGIAGNGVRGMVYADGTQI